MFSLLQTLPLRSVAFMLLVVRRVWPQTPRRDLLVSAQAFLNRSMISLNSKHELQAATRLSSLLLIWDTLFRYKALQRIIVALVDGEARTTVLTGYAVTFACCYLFGMSTMFAWSFEAARIKHFRLGLCFRGNPVRLVKLACCGATFTREELAAYKVVGARARDRLAIPPTN